MKSDEIDEEGMERLLILKKKAQIYTSNPLEQGDEQIAISRIMNFMSMTTIDSNGDLVPVDSFDSDGNLKTIDQGQAASDVVQQDETPAAATPATVAIATGEWDLLGIFAVMVADGNAANRVFRIEIDSLPLLLPAQPTPSHFTTGITLTLGQDGSISMGSQSTLATNDDGVPALVADENPLPMRLSGLSTITANATNLQAGDTLSIKTWARKVA